MSAYSAFFPFYEKLTPTQQSFYLQLCKELEYAPTEIKPAVKCSSEDAFAAIEAVYNDHPEFFWITGASGAQTVNSIVTAFKPKYNSLADRLSYHQSKFKKAVQAYLNSVENKPILQKEKLLHDRLVLEVDYIRGPFDQTAYSALVDHKSVCAGYSRAFQLLMQKIGIPCYYCSGLSITPRDTDWGKHAWNILKLGDDYYNVDVTWNDCYGNQSDRISYAYYNCTDAAIASNHRRSSDYTFLPKCCGTRFSYENVTGISPELSIVYQDGVTCQTPVKDHSSFLSVVVQEIKKSNQQQFTISLPASGTSTAENAMAWFEEAIAQVYGKNIGYSIRIQSTDYSNGWYRLTLIFRRS